MIENVKRNGHIRETGLVESRVHRKILQGCNWSLQLAEHFEDYNVAQRIYCPSRSATLDLDIESDWESLKHLVKNCHWVTKVRRMPQWK